jgi:predicted TIM-barrel fold metal-dependent hydrolase
MIVDAHVHVGTWRDPAFSGRSATFEETLDELGKAGVGSAFVFPTDRKENRTLLDRVRRHEGTRSPFHCWFFPWVDLDDPAFGAFLEAERDGVHGIKIHPSYDRIPVTDSSYDPFFEFADRYGLPVIIHCGRWQEVAGFRFALDRAGESPKTPFVLSHLGGDLPVLQADAFRQVVDRGLDNVLFGTESVREYWSLERGIGELGADRFLFGSDFSLGHPALYLAVLDLCRIPEEDRRMILGENALNLVRRTA